MTTPVFFLQVPEQFRDDPELVVYFNQINTALSNTRQGAAIADVSTTATNAELAATLNAILAQMRLDGDIKTV